MNSWLLIFIIAVVLVLWGAHFQYLMEKQRKLKEKIADLKSKKKQLQMSIETRTRRMDVLFSAVKEAVMRVDRKGRILAANPYAQLVFRMEHTNQPQPMLLYYRDPDWQESFATALKSLPETTLLPNMHIDNRVLAPRLLAFGKKQALLMCVDITEKHRIEAQRKTLFANLMHDLKTPLTSILGYARSVEAFGDDEAVRKEAVDVIASESVRANEFLDALLTLEHMESFSPDKSARCELQQPLDSVLGSFTSQLEERHVKIQWAGEPCEKPVKMEESDLHRILDNLIENALRYTPEKSTIFMNGSSDGAHYYLEIVDQGDGVSEKELPRLTERFYRGDKARAKSADVGHGLGLAIVKELLEKYGGSLELANHDVHGLIASITLPLASE